MDALDGGAVAVRRRLDPRSRRHVLRRARSSAIHSRWRPHVPCSTSSRSRGLISSATSTSERRSSPPGSRPTREASAPRSGSTHFSSWLYFDFPTDVPHAGLFYAMMRDRGVHVWEGRCWFLTTAHTDADLELVFAAFRDTLAEMQAGDLLPGGAEPPVPGARLRPRRRGSRGVVRARSGRARASTCRSRRPERPWLTAALYCGRSTSTRSRRRLTREVRLAAHRAAGRDVDGRGHGPRSELLVQPVLRVRRSTGRCASSPCAPPSIRSSPATKRCAPSSLPTARGQTMRPPFAVELPLIDLSDARSGGAASVRSTRLLERECETPFDLAEGPLIRAFVVRESAGAPPCSSSRRTTSCATGGRRRCCSRIWAALCGRSRRHPGAARAARRRIEEYVARADEPGPGRGGRGRRGVLGGAVSRRRAGARPPAHRSPARHEDLPQRPRAPADRRGAVRRGQADRGASREPRCSRRCSPRTRCSLYRLSGQSDFVVGIPFAGQPQLENSDARRPLREHRAVAGPPRPGGPVRRAPSHRP